MPRRPGALAARTRSTGTCSVPGWRNAPDDPTGPIVKSNCQPVDNAKVIHRRKKWALTTQPQPPDAGGMVQTLTAGDDSPRPQPDSRFPWRLGNPDRDPDGSSDRDPDRDPDGSSDRDPDGSSRRNPDHGPDRSKD